MNEYYLCKTKEEYDWLMKKLDEEGYKWVSGDCLTGDDAPSHWSEYEGETVIKATKELSFANLKFYENHEFVTKFINVGELMEKEDKFNLPSHYDFPNLIQPTMDIINIIAEANAGGVFKIGWYLANALKYLFRFRRKNGVADLEKSRDYINRLIAYFVSEGEDD